MTGFLLLAILVGIAGISFYVTGKALGEAEALEGFGRGRFLAQAALSGVPGILILLAITTPDADFPLGVLIWFAIAAGIHIPYCAQFFGRRRGTAVAFSSMFAVFLILALSIFIAYKIQEMFRYFAEKDSSRAKTR